MVNPEYNVKHKINFAVLKLKDPQASKLGSILVFFKGAFDGLTSAILYRRLSSFKMEGNIFWMVFKRMNKIFQSKKVQLSEYAYLEKDKASGYNLDL